ncbi:hypothetical protein MM35RIKEN_18190 (plasmid) [Vescimonas fastidiosa]|uniref:Uncharacterized protein n=1 Tax=Vescimonas fastidiosa TaxID=2714353 RepID=A0A810PZY1_9FIRM|nr:hypothetical protein [Vescimonas fastidiosa]BCK79627.1 hypothetical protein MM35RIKEN_18190 [Vescimonas fastidiosa]
MKRIDTCTHTDLLVGLLLAGIVSVLLAYRIFAYLCEVPAFRWWMILLGLLCAVLAIGGFLVARRAWKRLQYLRDNPEN